MAEENTGTEATEQKQRPAGGEQPGAGTPPADAAPTTVRERIAKLFGGSEVRSAQLRHEDESAARAADVKADADKAAQAAAATEPEEGDEDEEDAAGEGDAEGQARHRKRGKRPNVRVKELRGEISARDQRIANLEGQLEALKGNGSAPGAGQDGGAEQAGRAAQADDDDPEPTQEDYTSDAEYFKALGRWGARQELREQALAEELEDERLTQQEHRGKVLSNWDGQLIKGHERWEDFDAVALSPEVPYSGVMIEQVAQSEFGAELAYHLGRNREEAARIAHPEFEPLEAVKALAKIERDIESGRIAYPETAQEGAPTGETPGSGESPSGGTPGESSAATAGAPATPAAPSRTRAAAPLQPVKGSERPEPNMAELAKSNPAEYMRLRDQKHAEYLRKKHS